MSIFWMDSRPMCKLYRRLGRRGVVLALFGIAWVIQGVGYFVLHLPEPDPPSQVWVMNLPYQVTGSLWILSGILSVIISLRRSTTNDTLGFLAVTAVPMLLAFSYLVSLLTYSLPRHGAGWAIGLLGFSLWGDIVIALAVVASWPEPSHVNRGRKR